MTGLQFYSDLNTLVERAAKGGVDMLTIVEDLRLLATAMEALYVKEPRCEGSADAEIRAANRSF